MDGASIPAPESSEQKSVNQPLEQGTVVGRYLLLDRVGVGGLGEVYRAYDPELHRQVAVKLIKTGAMKVFEASLGKARDRTLREAQAMAQLSHPNVVPVHDVGVHGQQIFITMELIEGMTLRRWVRLRSRSWKQIRDAYIEAAKGLAAAHAKGIVHRDFKPHNVLVSHTGDIKVLDFGLARAFDNTTSSEPFDPTGSKIEGDIPLLESELTSAGVLLGTPQYMAPEQFLRKKSVGPAADQFAFCVSLWEALYGRRPFSGPDARTQAENILHQRFDAPPDGIKIPGWLHRALVQGLAVRPTDRHRNMHALIEAISRDKNKRKRGWLALGVVAVLSGAAASVATVVMRPEATQSQRDALEQIAIDARAAAAKSFFLYPPVDDAQAPTAYSKVLELEHQSEPVAHEAEVLARDLRREFADTLMRLGDRYWAAEGGAPFASDYYAAALVFDPDRERARERTALTPGEIASLRTKAERGDFSDAELVAGASLAILATPNEEERLARIEHLYASDKPVSESTTARLSSLLEEDGLEAIARGTAKARRGKGSKTRRSRRRTDDLEREDVAATRAEPESEPAPAPVVLEAEPETPEPDPPSTSRERRTSSRELVAKAKAAASEGRSKEAESLYHRALSRDPRNASALAGLANLHFERSQYQKAVQFAKKAVGVAPRSGSYRVLLGDAYFKVLAYDEARRHYQQAVKLGDRRAKKRLAQLESLLGE